jgi:hypothetical protein
MPAILGKKTKITLNDFPYKKDIEGRLFMQDLSLFEVQVLQEILNNSLKIPLSDLESTLQCKKSDLTSVLDKLSRTGLLARQIDSVFVDKEMRKYFEFHCQKFDDNFIPDIEFLGNLLSKIPLSILPIWYNIPKSSDNIFQSLIEKYFLTPKIYERHLNELYFDDRVLDGIIADLFSTPNLMLPVDKVREKYALSKEKLEETILLLELHLATFLSYKKEGKRWKGVLTPFREWRDLLLFQANAIPKEIKLHKDIKRTHPQDFGYLIDLSTRLKSKPKPQDLSQIEGMAPKEFLAMPIGDQALLIYRHAMNSCIKEEHAPIDACERSFREVEKSLRRLLDIGWVTFDDFMKGFISHVGSSELVTLKKVGIRWHYALPSYSEKEVAFIKNMVFDTFFKAGLTATGTYEKKPCFTLTPYGKVALGE